MYHRAELLQRSAEGGWEMHEPCPAEKLLEEEEVMETMYCINTHFQYTGPSNSRLSFVRRREEGLGMQCQKWNKGVNPTLR